MLRLIRLVAALMLAQSAWAQPPDASDAALQEQRLWDVLELRALMPIIRDEALDEAGAMEGMLFPPLAEGRWRKVVAQIHDPARMQRLFRQGVRAALEQAPVPRVAMALDFYQTSQGSFLIGLELAGRRAMLVPDGDRLARETFSRADSADTPRVAQIRRLIEAAGLIEPNVAGGLNAALAFSRGFEAGGGYPAPVGEGQILSDVWAQEPQIRAETLEWMESYLFLAYTPLSDGQLEDYIRFSASPEGKALSSVLFHGFDALFEHTSYDLGLAAAGQLEGRDL